MNPPEKKARRVQKPACILEFFLLIALGLLTLIGAGVILGPMLDRLFNSVFGMGLK